MEKMTSLTFPDGSSYEVVDAEARRLISEVNNKVPIIILDKENQIAYITTNQE